MIVDPLETRKTREHDVRKPARILVWIFIFGGSLAISGALAAGTLLSHPAPLRVGSAPSGAELVRVPSPSGSILRGWFMQGVPGHGAIVLMHGVHSSRLFMHRRAAFLHDNGFSVLLFDFQAHGESPGNHITYGLLESRDAPAALIGDTALPVDALVLESVYPTLAAALGHRLRLYLGPLGPIVAPLLTLQLRPRLGFGLDDLRPIDRIGTIQTPVFILAGTADRHTTIEESRALFDAARTPKLFWAVEGAGHEDLHGFAPAEYERRVLEFLEKYLEQRV